MCVPVPIREKAMTMRRILRCLSMPQSPISSSVRPVVKTTVDIISDLCQFSNSGSEAVDDDAKLAADLNAQQHREHRDCARTEECAELAERQHPTVQKAAGKKQPCNTDEHKQHACCRFGAREQLLIKPLPRIGK